MERLQQHPGLAGELAELCALLDDEAEHIPQRLDDHMGWRHRIPLAVHSRASLDEILAAFGRLTFDRPSRLREGVMFDATTNSDLFFITLEKAEDHYSPTTMYRDYAISPDLFHWESQSLTSVQSSTGQRCFVPRSGDSWPLFQILVSKVKHNIAARGQDRWSLYSPTRVYQPVGRVRRRTETGEAPRSQGATTEYRGVFDGGATP